MTFRPWARRFVRSEADSGFSVVHQVVPWVSERKTTEPFGVVVAALTAKKAEAGLETPGQEMS